MFKKRNIEKKVDVLKDIEQIQVNQGEPNESESIKVPKSVPSKKINKFSNQAVKQPQQTPKQPKAPIIVKYGLIDKDEVNSKYHANLQNQQQEKQPEKHSIVNFYVKKKMQELIGNKEQKRQNEDDVNAEQIMKMQKQYLELGEQKLAEYDIAQILKKLETIATNSIKSQTEARTTYLKNLLQNEHERMQYASKKELKTMKQQKQRIEQQFKNKYNDSGRRAYVEKMKYSALMNK